MNDSLISATDTWVISLIIFLMMVGSIYSGRKLAQKLGSQERELSGSGLVSALLGLLAFLLAFTFGMSGNRYDARRQLIIDEANDISTVVLRADLYPQEHREFFRNNLQQYLEARIDYYEYRRNFDKVTESMEKSASLSKQIWDRASLLTRDPSLSVASMQMIPALNAMMDVTTSRKYGELAHVPLLIISMLFILCAASAFFIGYCSGKGKFDWLMSTSFCFLTGFVIYITLDLDRPRRGIIQMDTPHKAMIELRQMFR